MRVDIGELSRRAKDFRREFEETKARTAEENFPWYPYDSMSNFDALDRLLSGANRDIGKLAGGLPILDIGCADGATSFFLERAGFKVDVIDNPPTNFNGMRGLYRLKDALKSNVNIYSADLDSQFMVPDERYGIVLFLGLLYHLKNPFYALETLASRARYCLLSTRIAKYGPDRNRLLQDLPIAYLVAPQETNNDATTFWIFSKMGLERLISRTGWDVLDYLAVGNTKSSDPASQDGDERAFVLLESERVPKPAAKLELLAGWHELEQNAWRWTEDRFSARVPASVENAQTLVLEVYLPESGFKGQSRYVLHVSVNGRSIGNEAFSSPGLKTVRFRLDKLADTKETALVECRLDPAQPAAPGDPRKLGVVVRFFDEAGRPMPDPFTIV